MFPEIDPFWQNTPVILAWLIGAGIVIGSAKHLFDTEEYDIESGTRADKERTSVPHFVAPLLPKYATSRVPYWTWLVIYMLLPLAVFALASWQWQNNLPEAATQTFHPIWLMLLENYPPLLVALAMHGISEILNGPSSPISSWRLFCLNNARVPLRAREIFLKLRDQPNRAIRDQQKATIEYMHRTMDAPDLALEPDDFDAHPNSMLGKWARACYFMAAIERHPPKHYSRISSRPELRRDIIRANFQEIAEQIATQRAFMHQSKPPPVRSQKLLESNVTALLQQVSQYVICVLFAADHDEEKVLTSLRRIGIPISPTPRYRLNPAGLAWSMIGFALFIFCVSLLMTLSGITPTVPSEDGSTPNDGAFLRAAKTSFSAASVVYFPALFVFLGKFLLVSSWPVRGPFSRRQVAVPFLLSALVGTIAGFFAFFLLGQTDMLTRSEQWLRYFPFCILSALTACIAAWCVDYISRPFNISLSVRRAMHVGGLSAVLYVVLGLGALGIHKNLLGEDLEHIFEASIFFVLMGACTAFLISISSDYFGRVPRDRNEMDLILARYVEPHLPVRFSIMSREELSQEIEHNASRWDPDVSRWLQSNGIVDNELQLTDEGYRLLTWRDDSEGLSSQDTGANEGRSRLLRGTRADLSHLDTGSGSQ